jgi:hypothetical protein
LPAFPPCSLSRPRVSNPREMMALIERIGSFRKGYELEGGNDHSLLLEFPLLDSSYSSVISSMGT